MKKRLVGYSQLTVFVAIVLVAVNTIKVFQGFTHIDEPNLVYDIFRFLQNLSGDRNLVDIIWPDTGMNGPLGIWIYSPILVISSYLLKLPIDVALRGLTLLCLPAVAWFLFRAFRNVWGERTAFWTTLLFLVTPYFTIHNHLAMGEVWYTLGLAISLDYLTREFRKRNLYLAFLFFGIGLAYKFTYAPLAILPISHVLLNWKKIRPNWRDLVFGSILLFCGFLPLIAGILLDGPAFMNRFVQMGSYTASGFGETVRAAWRNTSYGLGLPLMLLALVGTVRVFRPGDEKKRKISIVALISTVVPVVFLLAVKVVSFRYFYPLLIPVSMLAAGGIDWLFTVFQNRGVRTKSLVVAFLTVLVVGQAGYSFSREVFRSHGGPGGRNVIVNGRSAWKTAAIYTLDNSGPNDIIVTVNPGSFYIFGKRPMALNPIFDTFRSEGDSDILDYQMSGVREFYLDESVRYFLIPEVTAKSDAFPEDIMTELEQEWSGGGVGVYRYGPPKSISTTSGEPYHYDLRTIVNGFFDKGLMAPGRLKSE